MWKSASVPTTVSGDYVNQLAHMFAAGCQSANVDQFTEFIGVDWSATPSFRQGHFTTKLAVIPLHASVQTPLKFRILHPGVRSSPCQGISVSWITMRHALIFANLCSGYINPRYCMSVFVVYLWQRKAVVSRMCVWLWFYQHGICERWGRLVLSIIISID